MAAVAVENSAERALDMLLVDALPPTGASADRLQDGGWEKANTTPDGQHDELATAAAAMATAITDVLFDDMAGQWVGVMLWVALSFGED